LKDRIALQKPMVQMGEMLLNSVQHSSTHWYSNNRLFLSLKTSACIFDGSKKMLSFTFLTETKISPTLSTLWVLPLVIKKAHLMMLLSCHDSSWRHDVSFSPSVDMVLHLASTSPPISGGAIYTNDRERVCCLLVLNLVSSTPPCIRQPGPRLHVLGVCDFV